MEQIIKPTKYIDPMVDVAFKLIFGTEKNKHLTTTSYGLVMNYRNNYDNSIIVVTFAKGAKI
jgi:hypothetical protein